MFSWPDVPSIGAATWDQMSGVSPGSPLVGGMGAAGGIDPDYKYRRVAVGSGTAAGGAGGAPVRGHYSELAVDELAGILLAILAAGALLAIIKGGWSGKGGFTDWFSAKFLGHVR